MYKYFQEEIGFNECNCNFSNSCYFCFFQLYSLGSTEIEAKEGIS